MKARKPNDHRKGPGPNIIRAWFDTVFHYSLQGLATERGFLERRNWTYRFKRERLDHIGPLAEHLPFRAIDNLEQFVSLYPEAAQLIAAHDGAVSALREACLVLHTAIIQSPGFRRIFDEVEAETPALLGVEFSSNFGAYSDRADFAGILAEYLVNNVGDLSDTYSTSGLWNRFRVRFVSALAAPELIGPLHGTNAAGETSRAAVDELEDSLKATRSQLSLKYDVPLVAEVVSAQE